MTKDFEVNDVDQTAQSIESENGMPTERRKEFIEPELSPSIDILEATTFFQAVTSGVTN